MNKNTRFFMRRAWILKLKRNKKLKKHTIVLENQKNHNYFLKKQNKHGQKLT